MIETVQIPILLKAIDFVFEEGRKILEERRERRKTSETLSKTDDQEPETEVTSVEAQKQDEVKQELLSSKIDEILWKNHEKDVQHLVKLLGKHSDNYRHAKEQYAAWGSALVPPIIVNNMTEEENKMVETIKELEVILSKIYKKDIKLNR